MKFWTGVITEKVEASKAFYIRLFDCEVVYEGEESWFVLLKLGESELGFMKPGLENQAPMFRNAYQGAGMWISVDVDNVDAEYQRIQSLDIPLELEICDEPWGDRHFVVLDPNGIGIDIVQHQTIE